MDNAQQREYWNGAVGEQWAKEDLLMSQLLEPVSDILLESDQLSQAQKVLCVGCGGGSDTLRLLERVSDSAQIVGVDISEPLLAVARARFSSRPQVADRVSFHLADAGTDTLEENEFDLLFSRFGVMFFDDPRAAFDNLASHCAPSAHLLFSCWQAPRFNSWVTVPLQGALSVLEPPEPLPARAPGPFAFADADYVREILEGSGWSDVQVQPRSVTLKWGTSGDVAASARELLKTGPVGRLLVDQPEAVRRRVYDAVTEALIPYATAQGLELEGAIWVVSAVREN